MLAGPLGQFEQLEVRAIARRYATELLAESQKLGQIPTRHTQRSSRAKIATRLWPDGVNGAHFPGEDTAQEP
jgi:hypothetical protein